MLRDAGDRPHGFQIEDFHQLFIWFNRCAEVAVRDHDESVGRSFQLDDRRRIAWLAALDAEQDIAFFYKVALMSEDFYNLAGDAAGKDGVAVTGVLDLPEHGECALEQRFLGGNGFNAEVLDGVSIENDGVLVAGRGFGGEGGSDEK